MTNGVILQKSVDLGATFCSKHRRPGKTCNLINLVVTELNQLQTTQLSSGGIDFEVGSNSGIYI